MSSPVSQVVVGYDFSHGAGAALHRAVTLAGRAPYHVLHAACVVHPRTPVPSILPYNGIDYMYAARVQEALAAELHHALDRADVHGCVHFFVHARIGRAAPELLALAREVGADLIIVGSRDGADGEPLIVGSTLEQIVREASCTVEVARPKRYAGSAGEPVAPAGPLAPPHRYTYQDHRVNLRPAEWPVS